MKLYKKGQIVPKRVLQAGHPSYQHKAKFGCDCWVHEGDVIASSFTGGGFCLVVEMGRYSRGKSTRVMSWHAGSKKALPASIDGRHIAALITVSSPTPNSRHSIRKAGFLMGLLELRNAAGVSLNAEL